MDTHKHTQMIRQYDFSDTDASLKVCYSTFIEEQHSLVANVNHCSSVKAHYNLYSSTDAYKQPQTCLSLLFTSVSDHHYVSLIFTIIRSKT